MSHFFLAQTLIDLDRDAEAIEELKKVIAAPYDADWEPEDRDTKRRRPTFWPRCGIDRRYRGARTSTNITMTPTTSTERIQVSGSSVLALYEITCQSRHTLSMS